MNDTLSTRVHRITEVEHPAPGVLRMREIIYRDEGTEQLRVERDLVMVKPLEFIPVQIQPVSTRETP